MRVLTPLALTFLATACASSGQSYKASTLNAPRQNRPMVASMEPMATEAPQIVADDPGDNETAGGLLERAFAQFNRDDYKGASRSFGASIATNNLNEAGRALAYWHIYLAEKRLGQDDRSNEALSSFTQVAQEMIEDRDSNGAMGGSDFIERFSLDTRLSRARAILSATWAKKIPGYGKSAYDAVPVFDETEADYFIEIAPPCSDSKHKQTDKHTVVQSNGRAVQKVTVFCDGQRSGTEFYLEIVSR